MDLKDYVNIGHTGHFWHSGRSVFVNELCRKCLGASDSRRLLEIGCGTGTLLGVLSHYGEVSGLEIEPAAVEMARAGGWNVITADIANHNLPSQTFDAVCCFDVLEHLVDDTAVLKKIALALKPNGVLLLTVPAYPWLFSHHDRALGHLRRYRLSDLKKQLEAAGFSIAVSGYWNTLLFPLETAWRMLHAALEKISIAEISGSDAFRLPTLINKFCFIILAFESRQTMKRFWPRFGLTIYAAAQKTALG